MIGIDDQRQFTGAADAPCLVGKLGEGQNDEVGGAQDRQGGDRAGKHAGFETKVFGDSGRNRVIYRSGVNALSAVKNGA